MRLSRWQSFRPGATVEALQQFQQEMSHLFDRWGDRGGRTSGRFAAFPQVNVWEEPESLVLQAELPGVEAKDLELMVTGGNQLSIKGSRKQPEPAKGVWHRQERAFGNFSRNLELPFAVDAEKIDAQIENGVLTVKLSKHASTKPRKISVKGE